MAKSKKITVEHLEDLNNARLRKDVLKLMEELKNLFMSIEHYASKAHKFYNLYNSIGVKIQALKSTRHIAPDINELLGHLLWILALSSSYMVNVFLLYEPAIFFSRGLVSGNELMTWFAVLLLPLIVITIQVVLSIDKHETRDKGTELSRPKKSMAILAVLISPFLISASFLAISFGEWPLLHEILLVLAKMAFATITDIAVLSSGERGAEALRYLIHLIKRFGTCGYYLTLKFQHHKAEQVMENAAYQMIKHIQLYQHQSAELQRQFPDSPKMPSWSKATAWAIQRWMGDVNPES